MWRVLGALCLGLGLVGGCSESESTPAGSGASGGSGGASGSAGAAASGGSAGSAGTGGSAGNAGSGGSAGSAGTVNDAGGDAGLCATAADTAAVLATYTVTVDGGSAEQTVPQIAKQCGIEALFATPGDPVAQEVATAACIRARTGNAVSEMCVTCVVGSVVCGRENCLSQCLGDDQVLCDACLCGDNPLGVNCLDAYETCSGVPNTVCPRDGG